MLVFSTPLIQLLKICNLNRYSNGTVSASCEDICETIKKRVKEECFIPRYKLVCQVVLGEMKDQGVRVTSRCLWDPDSDNYASAYFKNVSIHTVCNGRVTVGKPDGGLNSYCVLLRE